MDLNWAVTATKALIHSFEGEYASPKTINLANLFLMENGVNVNDFVIQKVTHTNNDTDNFVNIIVKSNDDRIKVKMQTGFSGSEYFLRFLVDENKIIGLISQSVKEGSYAR